MRFFLDQNISLQTTKYLKSLGIDATDVREQNLEGASDETIYDFAKSKKLVLITFDHEFSYKFISEKNLEGLILLRVHPQTFEALHPALNDFFKKIKPDKIKGSIIVVELSRFRIRKIK